MMEATYSPKRRFFKRGSRRNISEDRIIHSLLLENPQAHFSGCPSHMGYARNAEEISLSLEDCYLLINNKVDKTVRITGKVKLS
jgi:hypothetical protein